MALLNCQDCGNPVSDQAPACPKCGRPKIAAKRTEAQFAEPSAPPQARSTHPITLAIALILLAAVGWSSLNAYRKAQLPPLPMVVKSRPAIIGSGQVIMFQNESNQPLSVAATLTHPATNLQKVYQIDTPPRGTKSIGTLEGWVAQSGDTITLANNNFQSWSGSIR
jgi:hypothetical protein